MHIYMESCTCEAPTTAILRMHTMGQILGNWRILAATLFSAVLVVGAYLFARGIESPPVAQASAETALLQAIAAKDSDGDGLPDWEEALYGTDPHNPDSFHLGMTDGDAVAKGLIVPKAIADIVVATSTLAANSTVNYSAEGLPSPAEGTLTDAFAKSFFTLYVSAKQANGGNDLSAADTSNLASQALSSLSSSVTATPDFKSLSALSTIGSGPAALKEFAVNAEAVFTKNKSNATTSEMVYLQYALAGDDTAALSHLASIAKAYRDSAAGLAAIPVPSELAADDTALVNAVMRVSRIIDGLAHLDTDPLTAMLSLQQYVPAAQALGKAFADVSDTYAAAGVMLPPGTPGASFVNMAAVVAARTANL